MSNTTVIAVTNSFNDTVTLLPPSANIPGVGTVLFHNNPRVEFDGVENVRNFDQHIDFKITKNKLHSELMGGLYHHYPRLKRRTQYLNVFKFNLSRPIEQQLTIPHYYMATLRDGEHVAIANFGIPKCEKVVIKEQLGARGSNQIVVPTNMLTTLLKHSKGKTLGEVKDMFPDLIYTDNSNWDMMFFDEPSDLFISELISNVKSEYRLLVGGDKIYGRERTIKQGPYPQANLDTDKFHTVQDVIYDNIEDMFDESLVKTLYEFVEYIDLPIGSVDLYATVDGTWGIFEYSTQFAFHGANPNFIKQLLLDGVKQVITRHPMTTVHESTPEVVATTVDAPKSVEHEPVDQVLNPVDINLPVPTFKPDNTARDRETLGGIRLPEPDVTFEHTGDDVPPALLDALKHLVTLHKLFIRTFLNGRTSRRFPNKYNVVGIKSANDADNYWSYTIDAGVMSLKVSAKPDISMVLPKQGYEIDDFVIVCENELTSHAVVELRSIIGLMRETVKTIETEHTANDNGILITKTKSRITRFVQSKLIESYSKLLTIVDSRSPDTDVYNAITHRAIGYEYVPKSGFDWCYRILAEDRTLLVHPDAVDNDIHIKINDDVPLRQWIDNRTRNNKNTDELQRIDVFYQDMTKRAKQLDAIQVVQAQDWSTKIQTEILSEMCSEMFDSNLVVMKTHYDKVIELLEGLNSDITHSEFVSSKETTGAWYFNLANGDMTCMFSEGTDGLPNFYLTEREVSLCDYLKDKVRYMSEPLGGQLEIEYANLFKTGRKLIELRKHIL